MFDWLKRIFSKSPLEPVQGEEVGIVTHYFSKPRVAVLKIKKGKIEVGDSLAFRGHTTNFKQKIESLQINHKSVQSAARGQEVGLQVKARVRPHDTVYKI